jgi:hypothetical protein
VSDDQDFLDVEPETDDVDLYELEPENAADPKAVKKRERKIQRQNREREEFWQSVFSTPVGRREIWAILQSGHCFEERFACGPNGFPQTEATWFHAGEQALVQRLYQSWQTQDYEGVYLMLCENDPRFLKAKRPTTRDDLNV